MTLAAQGLPLRAWFSLGWAYCVPSSSLQIPDSHNDFTWDNWIMWALGSKANKTKLVTAHTTLLPPLVRNRKLMS